MKKGSRLGTPAHVRAAGKIGFVAFASMEQWLSWVRGAQWRQLQLTNVLDFCHLFPVVLHAIDPGTLDSIPLTPGITGAPAGAAGTVGINASALLLLDRKGTHARGGRAGGTGRDPRLSHVSTAGSAAGHRPKPRGPALPGGHRGAGGSGLPRPREEVAGPGRAALPAGRAGAGLGKWGPVLGAGRQV